VDFSKLKPHHWMIVGGAIGMFVFGFLKWVTLGRSGIGDFGGGNVFDFFWTGTLPWLLVIASAVVLLLTLNGKLGAKLPWPLVIFGATALAGLLLLLRLLFNPLDGKDAIEALGASVGRGPGLILSAISGIVAAAGGFLNFRAAGGQLADLKDLDNIKSQFATGGATPPVDPPMPPPPPPPPPPPTA
jgi:hypothetical protein